MVKVTAILWQSHATTMRKAAKKLNAWCDLRVYSARYLDEGKEDMTCALDDLSGSDLIFFYRSAGEAVWDELENLVKQLNKPMVCLGYDPGLWLLSTVPLEIVDKCHSYVVYGGVDNFTQMLNYLAATVLGLPVNYQEPFAHPWEGLYHPDAPQYFNHIEDYLAWYQPRNAPTIGILFSRGYWVTDNIAVEKLLIKLFEAQGYNVIAAFCYSLKDVDLGTRGAAEVVQDFFIDRRGKPRISAMVKLISFFLESQKGNELYAQNIAAAGVNLLKILNVPIFQPIVSFYRSNADWLADPQGLNHEISWSISMPEFEGVIEPLYIGGLGRDGDQEYRDAQLERCQHLVDRVANWVSLAEKPVTERKVAFILHNNPCASVEATVGGGAKLDTLESVARILQQMQKEGYTVEVPAHGKELIDNIMNRKAISEFRWTTTEEIVSKGGALKLVSLGEYSQWFDTLSPSVKKRITQAWGNPPGEEINGVPAAMVHQGKILVTGVRYKNAIICVQPKRGCAGSKCDGQVCKILHDPDVPPPHQYLATYRYIECYFGADVIIHVGTHGNLEFLPGKGVGLSHDCFPDLALGGIPHLYIYNADNPPEGVIAKRRSYATLVNHMQTVMIEGGLYDELAELDRYLEEYEKAKLADPTRAHMLEHLIINEIKRTNLDQQIPVDSGHDNMAAIIEEAHGILSTIRNTQIQDGMHIFGDLPKGERKISFINSILRFDTGQDVSLRRGIAALMDLDLSELIADQSFVSLKHGKSYGALLEEIDLAAKKFIDHFLTGNPVDDALAYAVLKDKLINPGALPSLNELLPKVLDLNRRIEASKEIESLLTGFQGKYIPAGPSGLITRGRDDILPTGRNFYTLDPYRVPTKAAWEVGKRLADKVLEKHINEENRYPENIALYWMCSDIMWADGEGLGQMFYLLGVRPKWLPNGRVSGVEVIPLEELGRPRIDLTVRVSGITRDMFSNCVELLDEAVGIVAALKEPEEQNYVRKHTLTQLDGRNDQESWRKATMRIFAAKPGTYSSGVNLAVYASAWKEEKDLADIFLYWNGYAYGKDIYGQEAFKQLQNSLRTVDVTYNKVVTDEGDLLGCCSYFGIHGGLTAAAKAVSGKDIKSYYGDTREPEHVEVRTLADEVRRIVRAKLLNPKWIAGQKRHGYKGAGDISKRVGRVYGWEAATQQVDDWIFDDITKTFILDEQNRKFFEEHNPWAMEEIARRLLEAYRRGLWEANPEVISDLKEYYLEIEGWIEEKTGEISGEFQGGGINILTQEEVADWGAKMQEIKAKLNS